MQEQQNNPDIRSAYEKAADEGIDPRCIPLPLDVIPPVGEAIPYPDYPAQDHTVWNILYSRQIASLEGRVCREYIDGTKMMGFSPDKIPALTDLSKVLNLNTGWSVGRVPGLIRAEDFFRLLQKRVFPSTDYIRGMEEIDYTPAPDLFHDIFGHMPLLTNKSFADFYQKFGEAALKAEGEVKLFLERFHWFTVEFGLIRNAEGLRIYGAGIISSKNEVAHSLSENVTVLDFDPEKIIRQEYDVWHLQPILFAVDSFEQLEEGFTGWAKSAGIL